MMWDKILAIVIMGILLGTLAGMALIFVKSFFTEKVERMREKHELFMIQEAKRVFSNFTNETLQKFPELMKKMYTEMEKMDDDD